MTHHGSTILTYSRSRRTLQFTREKFPIVIGDTTRFIKLHNYATENYETNAAVLHLTI